MNLNMNELFEIAEEMEELMGTKEFLNELLIQMSKNELYEALEYIDRMWYMNLID